MRVIELFEDTKSIERELNDYFAFLKNMGQDSIPMTAVINFFKKNQINLDAKAVIDMIENAPEMFPLVIDANTMQINIGDDNELDQYSSEANKQTSQDTVNDLAMKATKDLGSE